MRLTKAIIGFLVMVPLLGTLALTGCSTSVLPETLEAKLASSPTAADHLAAALLYEKKARELDAEAVNYEAAASKVENPKGFHRGALMMAAQQKRQEAKEMQKLYALHVGQSNVLQGKVQPE